MFSCWLLYLNYKPRKKHYLPSQLCSSDEPGLVCKDVLDLQQRGRFESGKGLGLQVAGGETGFVVPLLDGGGPDRLQAFVT